MMDNKRYLPRAIVVDDDGSERELIVVDMLPNMYGAYRQMKEWKEAYGSKLKGRVIEVYGAKRKLYTINCTDGSK